MNQPFCYSATATFFLLLILIFVRALALEAGRPPCGQGIWLLALLPLNTRLDCAFSDSRGVPFRLGLVGVLTLGFLLIGMDHKQFLRHQ
jgi:hypothetical protein